MKAIETKYAGCRFRSRLEARWAVVFDHLGLEWQYEPEGFERPGPEGVIRYLPDFYLPATETWVEIKGGDDALAEDAQRIADMCDWGSPIPGVDYSYGSTRGLLVLGDIPRPGTDAAWLLVQHRKGLWLNRAIIVQTGAPVHLVPIHPDYNGDAPWTDSSLREGLQGEPIAVRGTSIHKGHSGTPTDAYDAGRSARFEFGESGAARR